MMMLPVPDRRGRESGSRLPVSDINETSSERLMIPEKSLCTLPFTRFSFARCASFRARGKQKRGTGRRGQSSCRTMIRCNRRQDHQV